MFSEPMAKVSFTTAEGEEKSFRLVTHRPVRIGRDPSNDVVLRDAKVSRSHCEILFERGFFVLHDLASANGSYVNGTKVRVAPLTDGAEIRLGGSHGIFSEELPEKPGGTIHSNVSVPPPAIVAAPEPEAPPPRLSAVELPEPHPPEEEEIGTAPHPSHIPPPNSDPVATELEEKADASHPAMPKPRPTAEAPRDDEGGSDSKYSLEAWAPFEPLSMRDHEGTAVWQYRRPPMFVSLVTNLLAGIVFVAGSGVFLLLLRDPSMLWASATLLATAMFTLLILALSPRRTVTAYDGMTMTQKQLRVLQESALPFPSIRYRAEDSVGAPIAIFQRNRLSMLAGRRWKIFDTSHGESMIAKEPRAFGGLLRLLTANLLEALRPQYDVHSGHGVISKVRRDETQVSIELYPSRVDRRIPLAFALLVATIDR